MQYIGDFKYGQTIYVPFATYGSNGESITQTGFAVTDIEIYKNGSVTQRASDNGYTLLDTDGIDFDSITGIHGFSIDTSDNTTTGFWGPGNDYFCVVSTITVNSQTVSFGVHFSIENRGGDGVLARTTIATLSTQVSFTLTAGSADNDAYNGCLLICHDQASVVQKCVGVIDDYTGSTKTIALRYDPAVFTMATGDYITIVAPRGIHDVGRWNGTAIASPDTAGYPKVTIKSGTGTGEVSLTSGIASVNATQIGGNTQAATNLGAAARSMTAGTVATAGFSPTTTEFESGDITEATADHYNGRLIEFYTGSLAGQQTLIQDYALSSGRGHFTVVAMTEAPGNGDAFAIV